jgi:hypothetical protein
MVKQKEKRHSYQSMKLRAWGYSRQGWLDDVVIAMAAGAA